MNKHRIEDPGTGAFAPGYKGKGMCKLCFMSDLEHPDGYADKHVKHLYCTHYMNWCRLVTRNCKGNE